MTDGQPNDAHDEELQPCDLIWRTMRNVSCAIWTVNSQHPGLGYTTCDGRNTYERMTVDDALPGITVSVLGFATNIVSDVSPPP